MAPSVREATPQDHGEITAILDAAYAPFARRSPAYHAHVRDPANWADDASAVLVAVEDAPAPRPVLGVVALALADSPLHERVAPPLGDAGFRFLAVAEAARGRGIGELLTRACIDRASAAGARRIGIYTMEFMHAAHRLYERLAFTRRPDLDVVFDGGPGRVYVLDLVEDAAAHFPPPGPRPATLPTYDEVAIDREPDGPPQC